MNQPSESQRLFTARATDDLVGTQNEKIPLLAQLIDSVHGSDERQPSMSPELLASETKALQAFIRKAVTDISALTAHPPLLSPTGYSE